MRHIHRQHVEAALLFALAVGVAIPGRAAEDTPVRMATTACTGLQGFSIPTSAIGLPTSGAVVQTAVAVNASDQGNINGGFCKAIGIVKPQHAGSPNLEFEVNLPLAWNGRALQM